MFWLGVFLGFFGGVAVAVVAFDGVDDWSDDE